MYHMHSEVTYKQLILSVLSVTELSRVRKLLLNKIHVHFLILLHKLGL